MKTTVTVRVQLEIDISDGWGADCQIGQVQAQAKESAMRAIRQGGLSLAGGRVDVTRITMTAVDE